MSLFKFQMQSNSFQKWYRVLGLIVFSSFILYYGSPLLIPLSFGFFLSFILQPVCSKLEHKGIGKIPAIVVSLLGVTLVIAMLLVILYYQFKSFTQDWSVVYVKLGQLITNLKDYLVIELGADRVQVDNWFADTQRTAGSNLLNFIESNIASFFVNLVMMVLIPVYTFLILYYRNSLVLAVTGMFSAGNQHQIIEIIKLSIQTYYNFIKGMAVVYFIVGLLNSIGLYLLDVPHAFLFGFLTAIMTFIPYVGIVVASLLPITYAWMAHDSFWYPLGVIGVFTLVQYLEANIIFPWAVSQKLQLNALVTLCVIVIGGILWGASGMILFVPFTAILKLIADRMTGWESLAMLLNKS